MSKLGEKIIHKRKCRNAYELAREYDRAIYCLNAYLAIPETALLNTDCMRALSYSGIGVIPRSPLSQKPTHKCWNQRVFFPMEAPEYITLIPCKVEH
jgi:hypothetical protein